MIEINTVDEQINKNRQQILKTLRSAGQEKSSQCKAVLWMHFHAGKSENEWKKKV